MIGGIHREKGRGVPLSQKIRGVTAFLARMKWKGVL